METNVLIDLCSASDNSNRIMLDEVGRLSLPELKADSSPSHGSIWGLLEHMLRVEVYYSLSAQERIDELERPDISTFPELREYWQSLAKERLRFISSLSSGKINQMVELRLGGSQLRLPRRQLILQGILHSIHHRGELSIVLTRLGHPLPTLDSILFFIQDSGQKWPF